MARLQQPPAAMLTQRIQYSENFNLWTLPEASIVSKKKGVCQSRTSEIRKRICEIWKNMGQVLSIVQWRESSSFLIFFLLFVTKYSFLRFQ